MEGCFKTDFRETGCEDESWIQLPQITSELQAFVNKLTNIWIL